MRRINWALWAGLLLTVAAFVSYFVVFALFPITRDVPWVPYLMFGVAAVLLIKGFKRKVVPAIVSVFCVLIVAAFTWFIFIFAKKVPVSAGAPHVGSVAPDFTLRDSSGRTFSFAAAAATAPKGVLLVFYRGYW